MHKLFVILNLIIKLCLNNVGNKFYAHKNMLYYSFNSRQVIKKLYTLYFISLF